VNTEVFEKLLDDCIKTLGKGGKIVVTGLGKNVPVCEKFVGTMWSLGLSAAFLHTNNAAHGDLGLIQPGDLIMILSKSGKTLESLYLMDHLKQKGVCDWAITFEKDSPLAKNASKTLSLELEKEGDPWNIIPNNSTTAYLILLQTLTMQLCKKLDINLDAFKRNHPGGHIGVTLYDSK